LGAAPLESDTPATLAASRSARGSAPAAPPHPANEPPVTAGAPDGPLDSSARVRERRSGDRGKGEDGRVAMKTSNVLTVLPNWSLTTPCCTRFPRPGLVKGCSDSPDRL